MPPQAHRKLQADDATFVRWLKVICKREHNGKAILRLFVDNYTSGKWADMKQNLSTTRLEWWPFLRGTLSGREIEVSRSRYLDRHVFIYKDLPSDAFVNDVLDIESAQINHRLDSTHVEDAPCACCAEKDVIIKGLKRKLAATTATPVETVEEAKLASLDAGFHRHYILDSHKATSRKQVREDMEKWLIEEFGPDERLDPHMHLWKRFCSEVVRNRDPSYRSFRCRKRQRPLEAHEVSPPSF